MSELDPGLLEVMLLAQQCLKEDVGRPEEAHLLAALTKAEEHVASGKKIPGVFVVGEEKGGRYPFTPPFPSYNKYEAWTHDQGVLKPPINPNVMFFTAVISRGHAIGWQDWGINKAAKAKAKLEEEQSNSNKRKRSPTIDTPSPQPLVDRTDSGLLPGADPRHIIRKYALPPGRKYSLCLNHLTVAESYNWSERLETHLNNPARPYKHPTTHSFMWVTSRIDPTAPMLPLQQAPPLLLTRWPTQPSSTEASSNDGMPPLPYCPSFARGFEPSNHS